VGATVLHTSGGKFGCLLRLEPNAGNKVCAISEAYLMCFDVFIFANVGFLRTDVPSYYPRYRRDRPSYSHEVYGGEVEAAVPDLIRFAWVERGKYCSEKAWCRFFFFVATLQCSECIGGGWVYQLYSGFLLFRVHTGRIDLIVFVASLSGLRIDVVSVTSGLTSSITLRESK
jgi:hypothetical protein